MRATLSQMARIKRSSMARTIAEGILLAERIKTDRELLFKRQEWTLSEIDFELEQNNITEDQHKELSIEIMMTRRLKELKELRKRISK